MTSKTHLLLVGGGHGHLTLLKNLQIPKNRLRITLISKAAYQYYSGMIGGYLSDVYEFDQVSLDLAKICHGLGIEFILDRVVEIHRTDKYVTLASNRRITYDLMSMNLGSKGQDSTTDKAMDIRPIENMLAFKRKLHEGNYEKIAVVGGGPAGIEMACNLQMIPGVQVTLLVSNHRILKEIRPRLLKKVLDHLSHIGIEVDRELTPDVSVYDHVLYARGIQTSIDYHDDFIKDNKGFPYVDKFLKVLGDPYLFGLGDGVTLEEFEYLPKNGFYAISQGRHLSKNLGAYLQKKALKIYRPRLSHLAIIPLGHEKALLIFGSRGCLKAWPMTLKGHIDRAYMKKMKKMEADHA